MTKTNPLSREQYEELQDFASKVEFEGGVIGAIQYGLDLPKVAPKWMQMNWVLMRETLALETEMEEWIDMAFAWDESDAEETFEEFVEREYTHE